MDLCSRVLNSGSVVAFLATLLNTLKKGVWSGDNSETLLEKSYRLLRSPVLKLDSTCACAWVERVKGLSAILLPRLSYYKRDAYFTRIKYPNQNQLLSKIQKLDLHVLHLLQLYYDLIHFAGYSLRISSVLTSVLLFP